MLLNIPSKLEKIFSSLKITDPKFPASEWDCLIPQAILTLNIFRDSILNNKLSQHAYLHGNFDFNATPLAPTGKIVIVHSKSTTRENCAVRGEDGCYI